jgi:hypothetical protein
MMCCINEADGQHDALLLALCDYLAQFRSKSTALVKKTSPILIECDTALALLSVPL